MISLNYVAVISWTLYKTVSRIYKSLPIPKALNKITKGISLVTVLTLHISFGRPLSSLTKILNIAGNVAIPFLIDLIYVTQG